MTEKIMLIACISARIFPLHALPESMLKKTINKNLKEMKHILQTSICFLKILFCIPFLFILSSYGQTITKTDSLFNLIKTDAPDTNKLFHLNELAWELMYRNLDTA